LVFGKIKAREQANRLGWRKILMGLTYINKNCEIYLGEDSAYREDMGSLPLDCIITAEEYNALPEERKKDYAVLVAKPKSEQ